MHNNKDQIRLALAHMLADDHFKSSPQMSAFLSYIVEQTLAGQSDRIKAYTIAVDALGKPDNFDPQSNPSVRVLAKRLRDTMDDYYQSRQCNSGIKICIKPGSYVPTFEQPALTSTNDFSLSNATILPSALAETPRQMMTLLRDSFVHYHRQIAAIGVLLMAVFAWNLSANYTRLSRASAATPMTTTLVPVDIASMEHIEPHSNRPTLPRLTVINAHPSNPKARQFGHHVIQGLREYQTFIVQEHVPSHQGKTQDWPEDYTLHYSLLDDSAFSVMLSHAKSGEIIDKAQIDMPGAHDNQTVMPSVMRHYAKRLLNTQGVILSNYFENNELTPTMRCTLLFDAYYADKTRAKHQSARQCATELKNAGTIPEIPAIL